MADTGRSETPQERADRNWGDVLQELRVSQTGAQLLAGFLMTLPFQQRFSDLTDFQRDWYLGLVVLAALSVGLTLTPVAMHRHFFGQDVKPRVVEVGHLVITLALGCVGLLLSGIVFLLFDVVLSRGPAVVAGGAAFVLLTALLVVAPKAAVARR